MSEEGPKVAVEAAEVEFQRFIDENDLDIDPAGMDEDDKASFVDAKRRIMRALMRGSLAISDNGEPVMVVRLDSGETTDVILRAPRGAAYMAMDSKKAQHNVRKGVGMLAEMSGRAESFFSKMSNQDFKLAMAIVGLFSGG